MQGKRASILGCSPTTSCPLAVEGGCFYHLAEEEAKVWLALAWAQACVMAVNLKNFFVMLP